MNRYHLFFDANGQAIVIENYPDALDRAPYDRISSGNVDTQRTTA